MRRSRVDDEAPQLVEEIGLEPGVGRERWTQSRVARIDGRGDCLLVSEQSFELGCAVERDLDVRVARDAGGASQLREPSSVDESDADVLQARHLAEREHGGRAGCTTPRVGGAPPSSAARS